MQEKEMLKIKYKGEKNIELKTLGASLNKLNDVLELIFAKNKTSINDSIKFNITKVKEGSFVVVIESIWQATKELIDVGSGIVTILIGLFQLRKWLKGREPKDMLKLNDRYTIINDDGDIKDFSLDLIDTYMSDPNIEKNLAKNSEIISQDSDRSGVDYEICDNSEIIKFVSYSNQDLINTSKEINFSEINLELDELIVDIVVSIKRANLQGDQLWELIMPDGKNFKAKVHDKFFLNRVKSNEVSFRNKTKLKVKLKITIIKDLTGFSREKTEYNVLEVNDVIVDNHAVQMSFLDMD